MTKFLSLLITLLSLSLASSTSLTESPPEFREKFYPRTIYPGSHLNLKCSATGTPLPTIRWFRYHEPLSEHFITTPSSSSSTATTRSHYHHYSLSSPPMIKTSDAGYVGYGGGVVRFLKTSSDVRIADYVDSKGTIISHLNLTSVSTEDGGLYSCEAVNDVGLVSHSGMVNVYGPPFVHSMSNVSVISTGRLRLDCPVSGYPIEEIRWRKDGSDLHSNLRVKSFPNGTLLIMDTHLEDEGWYTCQIKNKEGQLASASFFLDIVEKPVINPFLFGADLREGMRATVVCSILSGELPIQISWYKDGRDLREVHPEVETVRLGDFVTSLRISNIQRKHEGNYTCKASHASFPHIYSTYTSHMTVSASPKWLIKPNHQYSVLVGRNLVIDCQTEGFPLPIHQWKKKAMTKSLATSTHLRTSDDDGSAKDFVSIVSGPHVHVLENGSLVIVDAEKSDEGEYICGSSNTVGTLVSSPVTVRVHTPAHFKKNFESVKARVRDKVQLSCQALGDDVVKIIWSRDNNLLSSSSLSYSGKKFTIEEESSHASSSGEPSPTRSHVSRLTIDSVDVSDSAFYSCTATNQYGKDDMNIQLTVQGAPEAPTHLRAIEVTGRMIRIEWKESGDGNSPLIEYIVNYKKNDGLPWSQDAVESVIVGGKQTTAHVTGLRPSTQYKIRLFARNMMGRSPASEELIITTSDEAPSDIPLNVKVEPLSSTSLRVHWSYAASDSAGTKIFDGFYIGFREVRDEERPSSPTTQSFGGRNSNNLSPTYTFRTIELTDKSFSSTSSHPMAGDFHATLTDLKRNSRYGIVVQAFNRKGSGPSTEEVIVQTAEYDAPRPVSLRITALDQHSLSLSWDSSDEETPISGYVISYKSHVDNWEEIKISGKRSSYVLENLRCGTRYQISAVAFNKVGKSKVGEVVTATTVGNVPSAPPIDSLIKNNSTTAIVDLISWSDNGCPIMYFVVQYKEHFLSDWIMLSNNIIPEQSKVYISDLIPSTWYDLSMIAHSEAGSSEAQYLFSTLTPAGATISPLSVTSEPSWMVAFYDPVVVSSVICTCFIVIVVLAIVAYFASTAKCTRSETAIENYSIIGSRKMECVSLNSLRVKSVMEGGGGTSMSGCVTNCDDSTLFHHLPRTPRVTVSSSRSDHVYDMPHTRFTGHHHLNSSNDGMVEFEQHCRLSGGAIGTGTSSFHPHL